MKTSFKNALRVSVLFALISALFSSCDPKDGGASGGSPIPPPVEPRVVISATAPAKGWYGDTLTGTVTAQNAVSVTANPGSVSGNSYTVNDVKSPIDVRLVATDSKNNTAETTVRVDVYSQVRTFLSKNGQWKQTAQRFSNDSVTWSNGLPSCRPYIFNKDGTGKFFGSQCGGIDEEISWSLNASENGLKFTGITYFKTLFHIDGNMLILRYKNPSPSITQWIEETYTH